MELDDKRQGTSGVAIFVAGVIIGGVGGGLAGWLLGGHLAPMLSGLFNLLGRENRDQGVRFDAFQQ